jgi:hypothetical protein
MILELLLFGGFFAHLDLAGLNHVHELLIPDGITIRQLDSPSMSL